MRPAAAVAFARRRRRSAGTKIVIAKYRKHDGAYRERTRRAFLLLGLLGGRCGSGRSCGLRLVWALQGGSANGSNGSDWSQGIPVIGCARHLLLLLLLGDHARAAN